MHRRVEPSCSLRGAADEDSATYASAITYTYIA